jgi:hypothetical protein
VRRFEFEPISVCVFALHKIDLAAKICAIAFSRGWRPQPRVLSDAQLSL